MATAIVMAMAMTMAVAAVVAMATPATIISASYPAATISSASLPTAARSQKDIPYDVTTSVYANDTVVQISTVDADIRDWSTTEADQTQGEEGEWRCPAGCECAALGDGTSFNCSLPSGVVSFDEYGDGITFKCASGVLRCAEVPARAGLGGPGALRGSLSSVTLRGCALPAEPVTCVLARRGAFSTTKLIVQTPRTPLLPAHVRGLSRLDMLRITDLEGEEMELPLDVVAETPQLRQLTVDNARLALVGPLPALPLLALELGDDALSALPPRAFHRLPQLRRLGLWANNLTELSEDAFEGLDMLRELSLSSNRLAALPARLLQRTPRLTQLDLYDNPLRRLPAGLFAGLSQLVKVRLMDNHVDLTLEPRAFAELPALEELDASRSALHAVPGDLLEGTRALRVLRLARCKLRAVPSVLLAGLASLETLDLSHNLFTDLPQGLFSDLQNLIDLNLDANRLKTLPSSSFLGLGNLETLSLNNNELVEIATGAFVGLRSLRQLSLSRNLLAFGTSEQEGGYGLLAAPSSPFGALPRLQQLDLSRNRVAALLDDWRTVLVALRRLDLSWNNVSDLDDINMIFVSQDVRIDLRHNNISTVRLWGVGKFLSDDGATSGPGGGAEFLLDDNPFECDCHLPPLRTALRDTRGGARGAGLRLVAPRAVCAGPLELRGRPLLAVSDDELACQLPAPLCPPACHCLLRPQYFDLDCDALPDHLPSPQAHGLDNIQLRLRRAPADLRSLPGVRRLDLSHLNMTDLPSIAAGVEVNLTGNLLSRVPAELLSDNTLRLAGNRLACDCGHAADVLALQRAGRSVLDYAELECVDGAPLRLVRSDTLCDERNAIVFGVMALCVAAAVVWFLFLLHRLGRNVLYWVLGCGCCSPDDEDDLDKKYHGFLSFAHEDTALAEEILSRLEAPPHSLTMCVHYRDWALGDWIPEQISSSVETSRRTVIVLSRAFLSSYWGLLEFREAHRRALTDGKARVIVVVVGDVLADPRLSDELRAYLTTTTYLSRDDDRFVAKLAAALRPRRSLLQLLRRATRPFPSAPPPPAPPTPPNVDKLVGIALEGKLTRDGTLVNAAFTAPSL